MWSGASATASSMSASHSEAVWPGSANMRSRFTLANPAARIRS